MPLPLKIDTLVRQRLDELITEATKLIQNIERDNDDSSARRRGSGIVSFGEHHNQITAYHALVIKFNSLVQLMLGNSQRAVDIVTDIQELKSGSSATKRMLGILHGLKNDYETGMLAGLQEMLETNIVADYMGQAEQLLGEGIPGQYDYVPAAVLTGAVLEDALRRLCQRQSPPIDTVTTKGDKKTLDPLITDLQRENVINKAKADQLRSWAKIRNYAAHGEFTEFKRADVESLIAGVKAFIADYL